MVEDGGIDELRYEIGSDLDIPNYAEGLIAFSRFEGSYGEASTVENNTGYPITIWAYDDITFPTGPHGKGLYFDNDLTRGYVALHAPDAELETQHLGRKDIFTLTAWVQTDEPTGANGIIRKGDDFNNFENTYQFIINQERLRFRYDPASGSSQWFDSDTQITDTSWHHVTAVVDTRTSPINITLYIDGQDAGGSWGSGNGIPDLAHHFGLTQIGRGEPLTSFSDFRGTIDEVHIHKRLLSSRDVFLLHKFTQ
jgi:hypothetical protein